MVFRDNWLSMLRQIISAKGEYNSVLNSLIYTHWKAEQIRRVMQSDNPKHPNLFGEENAWDLLGKLNDGTISISYGLSNLVGYSDEYIVAYVPNNKGVGNES